MQGTKLQLKRYAASMLISVQILTGCAGTLPGLGGTSERAAGEIVGRTIAAMCASVPAIIPSRADTDETIIQIRKQTAARDAWCAGTKGG